MSDVNPSQVILLLLIVADMLLLLHRDINGRKSQEPTGFTGVVITLIVFVGMIWLYHSANALSTLW